MMRLAMVLALALLAAGCTTNRKVLYRNGEPSINLSQLLKSDDPVHIIFLHGMRATGSGSSDAFQAALCARLPDCKGPIARQTERIRLKWDGSFAYLGAPVWKNTQEWEASFPLVRRAVYANGPRPPVVVEEVNWWPLLVGLKCQRLVAHDAPLAGVSADQLQVCSAQGKYADGEHYAWIKPTDVEGIIKGAGVTGGAAKLNKLLKTEIMDWGISDAVIAAGPIGDLVGRGIGAAFAWAISTPLPPNIPKPGGTPRFVVIAESLGSFVAFDYYDRHHDQADALAAPGAALSSATPDETRAAYGLVQVLDRTDWLYFLANQVALLEFARVQAVPPPNAAGLQENAPARGLRRWATIPNPGRSAGLSETFREIVAFHDPNDLLTFEVPDLGPPPNAGEPDTRPKVRNVFLSNGPTYLGVIADPAAAHTAHARNSCVLDIIFDGKANGPCSVARAK
jgi:hypothetical protein